MAAAKAWENNAGIIQFGGALTRSLELLKVRTVDKLRICEWRDCAQRDAACYQITLITCLCLPFSSLKWQAYCKSKSGCGTEVALSADKILWNLCALSGVSAISGGTMIYTWPAVCIAKCSQLSHGRPCER